MLNLRRTSIVAFIAFLLALLGLLSPFIVTISFGLFGEVYIHIGTILFDIQVGRRISFNEPWITFQYLIFVVFRPVFGYYFYKYYTGKTTTRQVILSGLFGEFPIIVIFILMAPSGLLSVFITPLPLHIFVGMAIIFTRPFDLPLTPWKKLPEVSD